MECTHGTRMTLKCPQCESLKREQQLVRFGDCDPGDCADGTLESLKALAREIQSTASQIHAGVFPLAMSADAGSIGETRTDRRIQYEITSERTKQTIVDDLAEALTSYKWSHLSLEEAIEQVKAIVLDTVAA